MYCPHCGGNMPSDSLYCPYCQQPNDTGAERAEVLQREQAKTNEAIDRAIEEKRTEMTARILTRCNIAAGIAVAVLLVISIVVSLLSSSGRLFTSRPKDAAAVLDAYYTQGEYAKVCDYLSEHDFTLEDFPLYFELYNFYTDYASFRKHMNACTTSLHADEIPDDYSLESALRAAGGLLACRFGKVLSEADLDARNLAVWQSCRAEVRTAFLGVFCFTEDEFDAFEAEMKKDHYLSSTRRSELRSQILRRVVAQ